MSDNADRDRWVEPMLRRTMKEPLTAEVSASCLDGETIAAWADRTLPPAEAKLVERHLAECSRCSALLATFVRTAPEPAVSGGRLWHLRWLVPAATAATVVAIWLAVPGNQVVPSRTDTLARSEAPAPESSAQGNEPAAAKAPPLKQETRERQVAPEPRAQTPAQVDRFDAPQTAPPRQETPERPADALADNDAPRNFAREKAAEQADQKRENAVEPQAPQVAGAQPAPPVQESAPAADRAVAGARTLSRIAASAIMEVRSPNPAIRWRVTTARGVERTTTSGASWEAVSAPQVEGLVDGFSPDPAVCWLVGRAGTILVTTDGTRFVRVSFPEAIDLVSIRATDAQSATVVAADGRSFRTSDRGVTWTRIGN